MFVSRGLRVTKSRAVGGDGQHLKFSVTDGRMTWMQLPFARAIGLRRCPRASTCSISLSAIYSTARF